MAVRQSDVDFRYEVQKGDLEDVRRLAESTGFFREDEVDVAVELVEDRVRKGEASEYRFVFARAHGSNCRLRLLRPNRLHLGQL